MVNLYCKLDRLTITMETKSLGKSIRDCLYWADGDGKSILNVSGIITCSGVLKGDRDE